MRQLLFPTPEQTPALMSHGDHARLIWNLAIEQASYYHGAREAVRGYPPSKLSPQIAEIRAVYDWLGNGSSVVQQQARRDYERAVAAAKDPQNPARRPAFRRKKSGKISFNITNVTPNHVRKLNRRYSEVYVPKVGYVKFRRTGVFLKNPRSFRITRDSHGNWFVSFVDVPHPKIAPKTGGIIGIDRGVIHAVAVSNESKPFYDYGTTALDRKIRRAYRTKSKSKRGSERQRKAKREVTRLTAHRRNKRKDFIEKTTTELASTYDIFVLEKLSVRNMTRSARGTIKNPGKNVRQKSGLNRSILDKAWGMFATRLEQKAQGRVEYVPAAHTSQRCHRCGFTHEANRESQAIFVCKSCGYEGNADFNAACNVADGLRRRKTVAITTTNGSDSSSRLSESPQFQPWRGSQTNEPNGKYNAAPREPA